RLSMAGVGGVSILTGPERPVQHGGNAPPYASPRGFNPHRPRKAGATFALPDLLQHAPKFQSSPAPKGRCNQRRDQQHYAPEPVSTLTGPERPVQPDDDDPFPAYNVFQSSPAPKGRCNKVAIAKTTTARMFQSSPAPKGRCNGHSVLGIAMAAA